MIHDDEIFTQDVYRLNHLKLAPGWIVDLGSNTGAFVARCRQLFTNPILSVEANPAFAGYSGADHEISAAIGWRLGPRYLKLNHTNPGGSALVSEGGIEVEGITFAEISEIADPIALLKVDIEGSEYELPWEAMHRVDRIACEFHERGPGALGYLLERLLTSHHVEIFGHPGRGGYFFAHRYP